MMNASALKKHYEGFLSAQGLYQPGKCKTAFLLRAIGVLAKSISKMKDHLDRLHLTI